MERARREMSNLLNIMAQQDDHATIIQSATAVLLNGDEDDNLRERVSKRANFDRGRVAAHAHLWQDYFAANPTYSDAQFRRCFRMRRSLFLRIHSTVVAHDNYFVQKRDAIGVLGLSNLQKVCAAIRLLAYGTAADSVDEYLRISETTSIDCLQKFCKAIISQFKTEYLRQPTVVDLERILSHSAMCGFPGMIGSIDCMHWYWKNCPRGWAGQYVGRSGTPSIVLEPVASYDLWIWHAFFGMPGSNNDVNVLEKSLVFRDQIEGVAPIFSYIHACRWHLPEWSSFIHTITSTITDPEGEKRKHFAMMQESARKDVECAFGVLQAKWKIIQEPTRMWFDGALALIMTTCIILHNMIVEDERGNAMVDIPDSASSRTFEVSAGHAVQDFRLPSGILNMRTICDQERYLQLWNDLIEHLWTLKGNHV